jgi:hypothetical protein
MNKAYVKTWDGVKPGIDPQTMNSEVLKDVKQATQYFDGLGRPFQTIAKQGSLQTSSGNTYDVVSAVEYDEYGREQFKYLPFASTANDGAFKLDPFAQQATFMNAQYGGQGETFFYGQTKFEASPLSRPLESFAAGNSWSGSSWQTNESDRRSVKMKYWINTVTDSVKTWTVTDVTNSWGTYSVNGSYSAGLLYKNATVDENGKQVIEFKDKEGKVVLKKVQLTATADAGSGSGYYGWLCTYYIYDNYNNLRCVIQPEGVKTLAANGWSLTTQLLDEQCFRYEYDQRDRMIMKKVPGAGEIWMVYDARDRLVLTQDSNLRSGSPQKWLYTQYDELNRPIATGLWNNSQDRVYHKGQADASTAYPNLSGQTYEELTNSFYDSYSWRSNYGNPLSATYNTSYDTYFQTASNTVWPYPQSNAQTSQLKGLMSGTRTKVLGTSTYLYTVSFYDEKGRVIQVQATNNTGGTDIMTTQYSWAGQPLVIVGKTEKGTPNAHTTVIVTQITYDDLGRVKKVEKKMSHSQISSGAMPSSFTTTVQNEYDKLGQLQTKKDGNKSGGGALAKLDYEYNIRGWLLSVNKDYITNTTNADQYFGMQLGYDKNGSLGTFTPMYNGNISGTVWKSEGDQEKRKYDFTYDAANRITAGNFTQYVSGSGSSAVFNTSANIDFTVSGLSYDNNGNILSMTQKGLKLNSSPTIDNLTYQYQSGSNKLAKVTDGVTEDMKVGDFKDGSNGSSDDYSYDGNGNLTLDNNKAISSITYNHLNLPSVITVTGKGTITYTYDATGNKIKKVTVDNTVNPSKTLYRWFCLSE